MKNCNVQTANTLKNDREQLHQMRLNEFSFRANINSVYVFFPVHFFLIINLTRSQTKEWKMHTVCYNWCQSIKSLAWKYQTPTENYNFSTTNLPFVFFVFCFCSAIETRKMNHLSLRPIKNNSNRIQNWRKFSHRKCWHL